MRTAKMLAILAIAVTLLSACDADKTMSERGFRLPDGDAYVYNAYMTVQELTDLVMFLQPHYNLVAP